MKENIANTILSFEGIGLKDLDRVALLNRVDTKFVFPEAKLVKILTELSEHYYLLDIDGVRLNTYESIYFDTDEMDCYVKHHNRKANRVKLRYRKYVESKLNYFEVKFKTNTGRTVKSRIKTSDIGEEFGQKEEHLLEEKFNLDVEAFKPSIWIYFSRLTLVDHQFQERATIDLNLRYQMKDKESNWNQYIVAELKQSKADRSSMLYQILLKNKIKPMRFSKYCMGIVSLYSDVKINRFKSKLRRLKKIQA